MECLFTARLKRETTGDGLETEREFIGPIWTKTLASRIWFLAKLPAKARTRFGVGWKSGRSNPDEKLQDESIKAYVERIEAWAFVFGDR